MVEKVQATLQVLADLAVSFVPLVVLGLVHRFVHRRSLRAERSARGKRQG